MLVLVVSVRNRSTAPAECFGRDGTLDAGVPVRPVVAAGMRDIAPPLHGAGEGLEADAAGAAGVDVLDADGAGQCPEETHTL